MDKRGKTGVCACVDRVEQNEARQVEALAETRHRASWFIEKISGKNLDRPKLQEMLDFAREGDTVYVLDWSRISRSTKDLLELVDRRSEGRAPVQPERKALTPRHRTDVWC